jgi:TPR repeat protein
LKKAQHALEFGCETGDITCCDMIASDPIKHSDPNIDKVVHLYEKACEAGASQSCLELAHMYESDIGKYKNTDLAIKYYERSCMRNNGVGGEPCRKLAKIYSIRDSNQQFSMRIMCYCGKE